MTNKRGRTQRKSGPVERFVRGTFTILGGAGSGLGAGALGTHGLLTVVTGGIKQDGWGAAPAWLFIVAIGAGIGMITGLSLAMHQTRNSEMHALGPYDWLGVLAGLTLAVLPLLYFFGRSYWFVNALYVSVIVPPSIVAGRYLVGEVLGRRFAKRK